MLRCLIVDPDPTRWPAVSEIIAAAGHEAQHCDEPEQASQWLRERPCELLLLRPPAARGGWTALLEAAQSVRPAPRVLLLAGGAVAALTPEPGSETEALQALLARAGEARSAVSTGDEQTAEFVALLAHELRSPLNTLQTILKLLDEQVGEQLDAALRSIVRRGEHAGAKAQQLLDGLLDWARVVTAELRLAPVSLDRLLRQAREAVAPLAEGRQVEWLLAPLPVVQGDAALLRLAFVELLANALKFSVGRSVVRVEVGARALPGGGHEIWVRDNGAGYDPQFEHQLFQPFRRLHLEREFPGAGLGLAKLRTIAERHGGSVSAMTLGSEGAEFRLRLPA